LLGDSAFDGVFGLWYGKAPGVDRSIDVLRHANQAGSSPHGGVLAIAGDDPNAVSSTVTGCSDYDFVSVGMPVLYPASVQDMLDFGVLGIELSRYSGCWVGFKAVTDIAESSAIVDLDIDRVRADWPELQQAADVHIRWPGGRVEQERLL
jgi:indolepyruvate ferredoxin oxidoreductase